jgi:transposase
MKSTELYEHILGITSPWFVASVEIDDTKETVEELLDHQTGPGLFHCPECGQTAPVYDHNPPRTWRHLDTCQFQTLLRARTPRVDCPTCGVLTAALAWAHPHGRFTLLFESFAIDVLSLTQVQGRAAALLRLSPDQVRHLLARSVERGLERRSTTRRIPPVTLDEKSLFTGQHYVSLLCDGQQGNVLEVVEHRTQEAAEELLKKGLSKEQRAAVEVVSLDLWPAFSAAAQAQAPDAEQVYDRFHLSEHLNKAVDQTRRAENKRMSRAGDDRLKGTRYLWLRAPENLTEKQAEQLETLSRESLETVQVYQMKEAFRAFFTCRTEAEATASFADWVKQALHLNNKPLRTVVRMFQRHWSGLLAWFRHPVSNGIAESINERIQQLKAKARGFRTAGGFRRAILFHLGELDLYP